MKVYFSFLITLLLFNCEMIWANNLQISNISRPVDNKIKFDISWDNSWYANSTPNNWDAVWIFVKAQDCNTDEKAWVHVDLSTNSGNHSTNSPLQVDAVIDGKGVFIRRSSFGMGNIAATSVELEFQNSFSLSNVNFEVFGIEMVAVLQGDFEIGNAFDISNSFTKTTINSEGSIAQGALYNGTTNNSSNPLVVADFPKGYNQFYIMKYEITQEQYVRFLNLLNYSQQFSRTSFDPASNVGMNALPIGNPSGIHNRNGIRLQTSATNTNAAVYNCDLNNNGIYAEANDGQSIACNFLNWEDVLAYLDWAALRPMTELEYEKASRGFNASVTDELAWGNTQITATNSNAINDAGMGSEVSTTSIGANTGLAAINSPNPSYGPLRVGFAARNSPSRSYAGASYWGVLDMTGNVWEQTVSVGYDNGNISNFTGVLGDGEIDGSGNADQTGWDLDPKYSIVKGGSWNTVALANVASPLCVVTTNNGTSSGYYISKFELGTINNSSSFNSQSYTDYFNSVTPAILQAGQSYTARITIPSYDRSVSIWIDYDNDGVFAPNERVAYYANGSNNPVSLSFTPQNISGVFRLRAVYQRTNNATDPCTLNSNYGEVEDYQIIINGDNSIGASVSQRFYIDDESLNQNRHPETGGRGVRQF